MTPAMKNPTRRRWIRSAATVLSVAAFAPQLFAKSRQEGIDDPDAGTSPRFTSAPMSAQLPDGMINHDFIRYVSMLSPMACLAALKAAEVPGEHVTAQCLAEAQLMSATLESPDVQNLRDRFDEFRASGLLQEQYSEWKASMIERVLDILHGDPDA